MSIIICGDVCPTEYSVKNFKSKEAWRAFGSAVELMRAADVTIVNLECALTDENASPILKLGPNLKAPVDTAVTLKDAGVDICAIANNHVLDFGVKGLNDTVSALKACGLKVTGFGKSETAAREPLYFSYKDMKIALVAVAEHEYSYALPDKAGVWGFDAFETIADVQNIKKTCDKIIVLYHGGKEQCEYPSPRLRKACHALVHAGADIVICQHSHCIGVCEEIENSYILYGQGNMHFVNPEYDHPHWLSGLMLEIDFDDKPLITYHPIVVDTDFVTMANQAEAQKIIDAFNKRNEIFKDKAAALEKWHEFCISVRTQYVDAAANAFKYDADERAREMFPHYLDCEAHYDVWKELFPTYHVKN